MVGIQAGKPNLLKDVLLCFPKELGLIFVASTALVALQVCQPFLIQETVDFLASPSASINVGYGLIGGFFCVAAGIAVSRVLAIDNQNDYFVTDMVPSSWSRRGCSTISFV